jgi:hypothetical protein
MTSTQLHVTPLRVFVASAFSARGRVRDMHAALFARGIETTSRWAETPGEGVEELEALTPCQIRAICEQNDRALESAHIVLMLATPNGGCSYGEVRHALDRGMAVLWEGHRRADAWRHGVMQVGHLSEALLILEHVAKASLREWPVGDDWRRSFIRNLVEGESGRLRQGAA